MAAELRTLYPPIEPLLTGYLPVSDGHEIYYEVSGSPQGTPVIFVHGGPGGASDANTRRFFDPAAYRIVLFDQRGCGKSRPHSSLEANTTWHLVADMERLRTHLTIERWVVFGGSWGSTLSLAYAETHPERVRALIVRGIWLVRPHEIHWYYQEGASFIYPDAWETFLEPIPWAERDHLLAAYHRRLTGEDPAVRATAAHAWCFWEASTLKLNPHPPNVIEEYASGEHADALARLEAHTTSMVRSSIRRISCLRESTGSGPSQVRSFRGGMTSSVRLPLRGICIDAGLRRSSPSFPTQGMWRLSRGSRTDSSARLTVSGAQAREGPAPRDTDRFHSLGAGRIPNHCEASL